MRRQNGFTLIELSIVLVIIGLIVGGVLAGQSLIRSSEIRSLIAQKDRYVLAINTFKSKYNGIPGDMKYSDAEKFGFFTFTGIFAGRDGRGDGGGIVSAANIEEGCNFECGALWRHLSDAEMINGDYGSTLEESTMVCPGAPVGECLSATESLYMPRAKMGNAYFGANNLSGSAHFSNIQGLHTNRNVFFLGVKGGPSVDYAFQPVMSSVDAYSIDLKIDDGLPNSGKFLVTPYDQDDNAATYWSMTVNASSNVCTTGGATYTDIAVVYNANKGTGGEKLTCKPVFVW